MNGQHYKRTPNKTQKSSPTSATHPKINRFGQPARMEMPIPPREPQRIHKFSSYKDVLEMHEKTKLRYAVSKCEKPINGHPCNVCAPCKILLRCNTQDDGLRDGWRDVLCQRPATNSCAHYGMFYNWQTPPDIASVSSEFSQYMIFHPASGSSALSSITVQPADPADPLTDADMSAGEFAIYVPYGSGVAINPDAGNRTVYILSGVKLADIVARDVAAYPAIGDVPYLRMNRRWRVSQGTSANQYILIQISIAMFNTGDLIHVDRIVTPATTNPAEAGQRIVRLTSVLPASEYWSFRLENLKELVCIRRIFIDCLIPNDQRCGCCSLPKGPTCQGQRCGKHLVKFSYSPNIHFKDESGTYNHINYPDEREIINNVLNHKTMAYHSMTINEKGRLIASKEYDNLAYCSRDQLKRALKRLDAKNSKIEVMDLRPEDAYIHAAHQISIRQRQSFVAKLKEIRRAKQEAERMSLASQRGLHGKAVRKHISTATKPRPSAPKPKAKPAPAAKHPKIAVAPSSPSSETKTATATTRKTTVRVLPKSSRTVADTTLKNQRQEESFDVEEEAFEPMEATSKVTKNAPMTSGETPRRSPLVVSKKRVIESTPEPQIDEPLMGETSGILDGDVFDRDLE